MHVSQVNISHLTSRSSGCIADATRPRRRTISPANPSFPHARRNIQRNGRQRNHSVHFRLLSKCSRHDVARGSGRQEHDYGFFPIEAESTSIRGGSGWERAKGDYLESGGLESLVLASVLCVVFCLFICSPLMHVVLRNDSREANTGCTIQVGHTLCMTF